MDPKLKVNLIFVAVSLAVFGATLQIVGGLWDGMTHLQNKPDFFWSPPHIAVYSGVVVVASSIFIGFVLLLKRELGRKMFLAFLIILAGSAMQFIGGYFDEISHMVYGVDGVVTPSHLLAEAGLVTNSSGAFFLLSLSRDRRSKIIAPFAIMNIVSAVSWVGMNILLFTSSIVVCMPVHSFFTAATCAVM